eukprot:COSAG06_NODE_10294_length_1708_cov_1.897452_1_plen_214_part_00
MDRSLLKTAPFSFFAPFFIYKASFYQDRLGTNIRKIQKKWRFLSYRLLDGGRAGHGRHLRKTRLCFECFPYVCPEPVLAKRSHLYINGSKRPFSHTFSASGIGSDASSSSGGGVSFFATAAASSSPFFFSSSGPRASACALTRASSAAEESAAFFAEGLRETRSSSLFQSFEVLLCLSRACLGNMNDRFVHKEIENRNGKRGLLLGVSCLTGR